ncbi:MAG: hypothetical protein ACJ76F_09040 [Bacteroidia bacterium]
MRNLILLLFLLIVNFSVAQPNTSIKKETKLYIRGLSSENTIRRAQLEKLDTIYITGKDSGEYKIKSVTLSFVFQGAVRNMELQRTDIIPIIQNSISHFKETKKLGFEKIIIRNYKAKTEKFLPSFTITIID